MHFVMINNGPSNHQLLDGIETNDEEDNKNGRILGGTTEVCSSMYILTSHHLLLVFYIFILNHFACLRNFNINLTKILLFHVCTILG